MNKMDQPTKPRNHAVFARLFKVDPKKAEAYRVETLGLMASNQDEKVSNEDTKEEVSVSVTSETNGTEKLLKEEYIKLLKSAKIKVHPNTGLEKLKVKCQEE